MKHRRIRMRLGKPLPSTDDDMDGEEDSSLNITVGDPAEIREAMTYEEE